MPTQVEVDFDLSVHRILGSGAIAEVFAAALHRAAEVRATATPSRGQIAAQIMAGFAASEVAFSSIENAAEVAVQWADALLAELAKTATAPQEEEVLPAPEAAAATTGGLSGSWLLVDEQWQRVYVLPGDLKIRALVSHYGAWEIRRAEDDLSVVPMAVGEAHDPDQAKQLVDAWVASIQGVLVELTAPKPAPARDPNRGQFAGPWYRTSAGWCRQYELTTGRQFVGKVDPYGSWEVRGIYGDCREAGRCHEVKQAQQAADAWVAAQGEQA